MFANDGAPGAVGSVVEASYALELSAIAAAPEMFPVGLVEDPCPVRELVQVEIAAVVQFEEDRSVRGKRDVPGLRANAGKHLACRSHHVGQRLPAWDGRADDGRACVGVRRIDHQVRAGAMHHPCDASGCQIDSPKPIGKRRVVTTAFCCSAPVVT